MSTSKIMMRQITTLDYDEANASEEQEIAATSPSRVIHGPSKPNVMVIFSSSDINAAAYHLTRSLQKPLSPNPIATVLVQEGVHSTLADKVRSQLKPFAPDEPRHPRFNEAIEKVQQLNARTIVAAGNYNKQPTPTIVCDMLHSHIADEFTGVVTLHTFRTAKEAIMLYAKEKLEFASASIWNENHSSAYELVSGFDCENFYLNCLHVPLDTLQPHIDAGENYVVMDKLYHYETMKLGDKQKSIVFPIGTIFAN